MRVEQIRGKLGEHANVRFLILHWSYKVDDKRDKKIAETENINRLFLLRFESA